MKAVILARVSSKEQEEGHSIEAQIKRLQEYCQRKGLEVIKTFQITESSTKGDRKRFMEMLNFCKTQKDMTAVVADAVDRIQRSFAETPLLDGLIKAEIIELHFLRENMIIGANATSSDIMRWDYSIMGAKHYILSMKENVARSIDLKIEKGELCGQAPLGYLNAKDSQGKSTVIVDPERGHIMRKLFEEYGTGLYSLNQIVQKAKELEFRTKTGKYAGKSTIANLFKNPFYAGTIIYTKNSKSRNPRKITYKHKYEKLISEQLFEKCQAILQGKNTQLKSQTKYREKDFLFRGLIRCGNCGYVITNDEKVKPNGKRYVYLSCPKVKGHCGESRINEQEALKEIEKVFKSFKIPDGVLNEIKEHLRNSLHAKTEYRNRELARLEGLKTKIRNKKDNLLDMKLEGEIDKATYDKKKEQFDKEFEKVSSQITNYDKADEQFAITLGLLLDLASNAYELFKSSNLDQKRRLLSIVFSNFSLKGKKLEFSITKPFDAMVKWAQGPDWLGNLDSNQD